jgi:hypothetical protein
MLIATLTIGCLVTFVVGYLVGAREIEARQQSAFARWRDCDPEELWRPPVNDTH